MKVPRVVVGVVLSGVVLSCAVLGSGSPARAAAPPSGASVRVVNLVRLGSKPSSILVFDTELATTGQKPIARLTYGSVSKPFRPRADESGGGSTTLSFYRPGAPTNASLLGQWTEDLAAGDRLTVLVQPNDDDPEHIPVFANAEWEHGGKTPLPSAAPGKALLLGQGFGLPKSNATTFGVQYGIVGRGCISPLPDDLGNISYVGATNTVPFTIEPGHLRLAAYNTDDRSCSKRPLAAPVTINANAGDRVYVFAFGSPHQRLELLPVPIPPA
jgi:hypothetical protein